MWYLPLLHTDFGSKRSNPKLFSALVWSSQEEEVVRMILIERWTFNVEDSHQPVVERS